MGLIDEFVETTSLANEDGKSKAPQEQMEKPDTQEYFDELFKRIASKKTRKAADELFSATDGEIKNSFNSDAVQF